MNREQRKRQLIAQGAIYRAEVLLAKQAAEESLRPDTLARSVLQQGAAAVIAAFRGGIGGGSGALPGVNLQTLLPLLMGGLSALSKRKSLLKTIVRGAAFAGTAASLAALVTRKKKAPAGQGDEAPQA